MKWGKKHKVPANVYLVVSEILDPTKGEYMAKVIQYKKDKSAIIRPSIGYKIRIDDIDIGLFFDIISRIKSQIIIEKLGGNISDGCDISQIIKVGETTIDMPPSHHFKPSDISVAVDIYNNLFAGDTLILSLRNQSFRVDGREKVQAGVLFCNIFLSAIDGSQKGKCFTMEVRADEVVIYDSNNQERFKTRTKQFFLTFKVIHAQD
jgi:hypothetical protein